MGNLTPQQQEVLLHIHQSQHDESLAHRGAILNAFSLSMAGLMALAAGATAPGYMTPNVKYAVVPAIVIVCVFIVIYIRQQRQASEKAMEIIRAIDTQLELFDKDKYLHEKSVLPENYAKPQPTWIGLSRRVDLWLVLTLVLLGLSIIALVILLPPRPLSP